MRNKRYKLIYYYADALGQLGAIDDPKEPEWELFDLEKDPQEMNSVYYDPAYADVAAELTAELERLQTKVKDEPYVPGKMPTYIPGMDEEVAPDEAVLWYEAPAEQWVEALPVGNGRLGAMVFGGVESERLQLNEDTLWSGYPRDCNNPGAKDVLPFVREAIFAGDYERADELAKGMQGTFTQSYQPFGDLRLYFEHEGEVTAYRRDLDLDTAVASVSYRIGETNYTRELFASAPDQAILLRLTADKPGQLNLSAQLDSKLRFTTEVTARGLAMSGRCPSNVVPSYKPSDDPVTYADDPAEMGMAFAVQVEVSADANARLSSENGALRVTDACEVTLVITAATGFNGFDQLPGLSDIDPVAIARQQAAVRAHDPTLWRPIRAITSVSSAVLASISGARLLRTCPRSTESEPTRRETIRRWSLCSSSMDATCSLPARGRAERSPPNLQGLWNDDVHAAVGQQVHDQHQHRDELLAGRGREPRRVHEPLFDWSRSSRVTGGETARTRALRRARLGGAPQHRPLAHARRAGSTARRWGACWPMAAPGSASTSGSTTSSAATPSSCASASIRC